MDKSVKRVIGFVKPKGETPKSASKEKKIPVKEPEKEPIPEEKHPVEVLVSEVQKDANNVAIWIKEHDFINRSALCKAAKVDRANFDKYLKLGELPEKMAKPIREQLKKYGYAE